MDKIISVYPPFARKNKVKKIGQVFKITTDNYNHSIINLSTLESVLKNFIKKKWEKSIRDNSKTTFITIKIVNFR